MGYDSIRLCSIRTAELVPFGFVCGGGPIEVRPKCCRPPHMRVRPVEGGGLGECGACARRVKSKVSAL